MKVLVHTLDGIERPALGASVPAQNGRFLLIDAGANVETTPRNLVDFAIMGSVYSEFLFGLENPTVGLISVGGEDSKGNDLTKEAFKLLEKTPINFIGNVEANTVFEGKCNVLVSDGFTGNVLLKTCEGLARSVSFWLKEVFTRNILRKIFALLNKRAFRELKAYGDPNLQGGAPLLGLNGVCIVGHGSSSPIAVTNAIRLAGECIKFGVNDKIKEKIKIFNDSLNDNDTLKEEEIG